MIDTKLIDILPENMPDEAAYLLVNFMSELAITLEDHYFTQLQRYAREKETQQIKLIDRILS
jgi:hypothetical protein